MTFASFLTACLTGMGVGSGGLFIVYLTMLAGYPQLEAQGLNLHFFIFSTAFAMLVHTRSQNLPFRRLGYICFVGGFGCAGGAMLAQTIDGGMLKTVFAVVLILSGSISLLSNQKNKKIQKPLYK